MHTRDKYHFEELPARKTMYIVEKLADVETAKRLMIEAVSWSVMKWLREKKTVRRAADKANAALDRLNLEVKRRWSEALQSAYAALPGSKQRTVAQSSQSSEMMLTAKKIKEADDAAYRARMDAERTFDEAEKQLSTSLAREGCRKAIESWNLHEKAISKAEAAWSSK